MRPLVMLFIFLKRTLGSGPSEVSYTSFSLCSGGPTEGSVAVRIRGHLTRDPRHQSVYDHNVLVPSGLHLRALVFFSLVLAGVSSPTFQAITSLVVWQVASSTLVADHPEVKGPVAL